MATLVAIAYPDLQTAFEVRKALAGLQKQYLLDLADAVVVTRDAEGKVKLDQSVPVVEAGAANGALWGGLIGLLFLNPLAGAAVGAATGGLLGKATDYGIEDGFMRDLGARMQANTSALFLLTQGDLNDRVLPEIGRYGGTVLQTSLPSEGEARLREALEDSAYRASGGAVGGSTSSPAPMAPDDDFPGSSAGGGATGGGSGAGGTTTGAGPVGGPDAGGTTVGGVHPGSTTGTTSGDLGGTTTASPGTDPNPRSY